MSTTSTGSPRNAAVPHEPADGPAAHADRAPPNNVREDSVPRADGRGPVITDCENRAQYARRETFGADADEIGDCLQLSAARDRFQNLVLELLQQFDGYNVRHFEISRARSCAARRHRAPATESRAAITPPHRLLPEEESSMIAIVSGLGTIANGTGFGNEAARPAGRCGKSPAIRPQEPRNSQSSLFLRSHALVAAPVRLLVDHRRFGWVRRALARWAIARRAHLCRPGVVPVSGERIRRRIAGP